MKNINWTKFFIILLLVFTANIPMVYYKYTNIENINKNGIETNLLSRYRDQSEIPFWIKVKYTFHKVDQTYYETENNKKYYGYKLSEIQSENLSHLTTEKFDSCEFIIYDKNSPENYMTFGDYKYFSIKKEIINHILISTLIFAISFYFVNQNYKTPKKEPKLKNGKLV